MKSPLETFKSPLDSDAQQAVAFGAAIAGGAVLGPIGAVLALPFAAMVQGFASNWGNRYEIVENPLVAMPSSHKSKSKKRK